MNMIMSSFGMKIGMFMGLSMLVIAYTALFFGHGVPIVDLMASLYLGYAVSLMGGVIGFVWGFVHGYILGLISDNLGDRLIK